MRYLFVMAASLILVGCETRSAVVAHHAPEGPIRALKIEPCQNRTDYAVRDLANEASQLLTEKIAAKGMFEVRADAPFLLTCDVERFVEGSALERWAALTPGPGASYAQVAVVVWQQPGQQILVTLRGQGAIKTGGLYTIGADQYILGVAVDEVVRQLESWATPIGAR